MVVAYGIERKYGKRVVLEQGNGVASSFEYEWERGGNAQQDEEVRREK